MLKRSFNFLSDHWDQVSAVSSWLWTLAGGTLMAWAAFAADIFPQYAPFSWVAAGIAGALVVSIALWFFAKTKLVIMHYGLLRKMNTDLDGVNPLDDNFYKKRIHVLAFSNPIDRRIESKSFDKCELIGPTTVVMNNAIMHNPSFIDCNFICVKDNWPVAHITSLSNCVFTNCKMYGITFLIPESATDKFQGAIPWVSRIPKEFGLAELPRP